MNQKRKEEKKRERDDACSTSHPSGNQVDGLPLVAIKSKLGAYKQGRQKEPESRPITKTRNRHEKNIFRGFPFNGSPVFCHSHAFFGFKTFLKKQILVRKKVEINFDFQFNMYADPGSLKIKICMILGALWEE